MASRPWPRRWCPICQRQVPALGVYRKHPVVPGGQTVCTASRQVVAMIQRGAADQLLRGEVNR
jgi:hypothetical protein